MITTQDTKEREEREARLKAIFDEISDTRLFEELVAFFGIGRTIELYGWASVAALVSSALHRGDTAAMRRDMEARGQTKSVFYRVLADFKRFADFKLEGSPLVWYDHRPTLAVVARIAAIHTVTSP